MYAEAWVLQAHPSTPQGPCCITLRGAAVEANVKPLSNTGLPSRMARRHHESACFPLSTVDSTQSFVFLEMAWKVQYPVATHSDSISV